MGHNPPNGSVSLAAMHRFQAPNIIVFTRSRSPPIAGLAHEDGQEKAARDVDASTNGVKRELRGMSGKSSLNLARVLSSLDWAKNGECLHLSLTYWKRWPSSKEDLAAEKSALVRDLGRHIEAGIWRLEYQVERFEKTGDMVPHWHVLSWLGARASGPFEIWLRSWWSGFSGNSSDHGVKVTSGDQARGVWYLAMHAAKRAQSPPFAVGRWWGYVNRSVLLGAQDLHNTGEVFERERVWWARLYKRATGAKFREEGKGFSWFLPRAWQCVAFVWIQQRIEDERRERSRPRNPF